MAKSNSIFVVIETVSRFEYYSLNIAEDARKLITESVHPHIQLKERKGWDDNYSVGAKDTGEHLWYLKK